MFITLISSFILFEKNRLAGTLLQEPYKDLETHAHFTSSYVTLLALKHRIVDFPDALQE